VDSSVHEGTRAEQNRKFVHWLLKQPPATDTQRGWVYSNAGYAIAGEILAQAAGKSWEELIREEVFDALGVEGDFGWPTDTSSHQPLGHIVPAAWGIGSEADLVPLPDSLDYDTRLVEPAGDVSISIGGYAVWLQENLRGMMGQGTLLDSATYHRLHFGFDSYAYGWGTVVEDGVHVVSHDGSAGTFYCHAVLLKEQGYGYAVFANSGNAAGGACAHQIGAAIMNIVQKKAAGEL
jgi:CubicO group peptidase (beta-lactamase class C family)